MPANRLTLPSAALFIVSVCLLFIPELRIWPMRAALLVLSVVVMGSLFWTYHKAGLFNMTIGQLHRAANKPRTSLLTLLAILAATAAIMVATP